MDADDGIVVCRGLAPYSLYRSLLDIRHTPFSSVSASANPTFFPPPPLIAVFQLPPLLPVPIVLLPAPGVAAPPSLLLWLKVWLALIRSNAPPLPIFALQLKLARL